MIKMAIVCCVNKERLLHLVLVAALFISQLAAHTHVIGHLDVNTHVESHLAEHSHNHSACEHHKQHSFISAENVTPTCQSNTAHVHESENDIDCAIYHAYSGQSIHLSGNTTCFSPIDFDDNFTSEKLTSIATLELDAKRIRGPPSRT